MSLLVRDPVYLQLHKVLRNLLRREQIPLGGRFLTEREVSTKYAVSRATANKALANLVAEGVLEFRKGLGTFVRCRPLDYDLQSLVSFTGKARAAGKNPSTRVLRFKPVPAASLDPALAAALAAPPDGCLHFMERLRLADRVAVILERRYVRAEFCPGLEADDLRGSLYDLWTEKYRLAIAGAEQRICAVNLRGRDARLLAVPAGKAGFRVTSIGYVEPQQPLWWEQTLYRSDAYEFHNVLGPIRSAGPATGVLREPARAGRSATTSDNTFPH